jgi:hypothetical protein
VVRQDSAQIRVLRAVRVEVGAEGNQDGRRPTSLAGLEQVIHESLALERVPTQREQLLELVYDEQRRALVSQPATLEPEAEPARVSRQLIKQERRRARRVVVTGQRERQ